MNKKRKQMQIRRRITSLTILVLLLFFGTKLAFSIKDRVEKLQYPYKYESIVNKYSKKYNLNPLFVLSVIKVESNFEEKAKSSVGAIGLMQITEETGKEIANKIGYRNFMVNDLYNPEINIEFGCFYLKDLFKEFNDRDLVIAAYNGGRGNVKNWLRDQKYSKDGDNLHNIPFPETREYVEKVNKAYKMYKKIYGNEEK